MHGTILITQPDPCSCALCRINELYEQYDYLASVNAPQIPRDGRSRPGIRDIELDWNLMRRTGKLDWTLDRRAGKRFWRMKDQMK